jgi:GT2 family glycosyltransferase
MKKTLPMVSIIMLVHNAPKFVKRSIITLSKTKYDGELELIVVDNKSEQKTRKLLNRLYNDKKMNKLLFLDENTLFARGNNTGVKLCDKKTDLVLLLNSDIEIKDSLWLNKMVNKYKKGIISLGFVEGDPYSRADGYCFMIDRKIYEKYQLDENFERFWSITKIQAQVLKDGLTVKAVKNHENLLHHFGGASGGDWNGAKGMDIEMEKVIRWFGGKNVDVIDKL